MKSLPSAAACVLLAALVSAADDAGTVGSAGAKHFQTSPPSYPSPWGNGNGDWADAYTKARAFVKQLTLEEKVNLTTGTGFQQEACEGQTGTIPRLGFRGLCLQDGPLGIRPTDLNSVFPAGVHVAATWDRQLMYKRGNALGAEFRDKGIDVLLGPVAGPLGRAPAAGRNWEGFSPDPVLTGIVFAETIKGIQDAGVIAVAKHLIGNEQENFRNAAEAQPFGYNITESISSNIDDVTMHELYLWPFADAVKAGVGAVMCAYNQVNNSYSCQNSYLLNHLLKNELDFQGFVTTDWSAHHSGVSSALAGLDMSMPGDSVFGTGQSFWGTNLTLAVINGTVPEWRIDDMATRIMAAWYKVGRDHTAIPINYNGNTLNTTGPIHFLVNQGIQKLNYHVDVRGDHSKIIREIGAKGTVLLKNKNNALPLNKPKSVAVIGKDATGKPEDYNSCEYAACDPGTLPFGWGSGSSYLSTLVNPLDALQKQASADNTIFQSVTDNYNLSQVRKVASVSDAAIVFVNADSGEYHWPVEDNYGDRKNLTLWQGGQDVVLTTAASCKNTIVVLHSVGPVLIDSFANHPNITAILWGGLPGEESGNSITDVLYGKVPPTGKTPFTWGKKRVDWGTDVMYQPNGPVPQQDFVEGIFIDYRHFDRASIQPLYEFGFGLTYTTFSYSNLQVKKAKAGPYKATTGKTPPATVLGNFSKNLADYQFPASLGTPVPLYIYPFINGTDAARASGDPDYGDGNKEYIPAHAQDPSPQPLLAAGGAPGGNPGLYDVLYDVSATIKNTGKTRSAEVVQLYVSLGGPRDAKVVLRGFDRLELKPGEEGTFKAQLTRRDLSNWDSGRGDWVVTGAEKRVFVGRSSRGLELEARLG